MNQSHSFLRNLLLMLVSLLLTLFILSSITYLYLDSQLPDVAALRDVQLPIPLRVYSSDGQLMAEFGELRRNPVAINQVPPLLIKAILATEDQRFYEHSGVDVYGLLRATTELFITGTKAQGGSTITMQVARNFYLTRKKTFIRKLTEIMLALKIEREFSKDQILELYLNKIYLGNRAYGVAAAAQVYFGKTLDQLTLPEMAVIAGLPKAPSTINPIVNPIAAKDRRNHVLDRMYELGYIDKKTYEDAINTPLTASFHGQIIPVNAPYVAEMVRNMMVTSFGDDALTKGYNVYTTIDSKQQQMANQALRSALIAYDHRHGYRAPKINLGIPTASKTIDWLANLEKIHSVNGLKPAAVVSLTNTTITALMGDGNLITIPWAGMSWARPELENGALGASPRTASDIVKIGDVIRVQKTPNDSWELSQIPDAQGAFVALSPQNGAITALVGGFDFNQSKFNRVTQAQRQPGSSFKPFIYAAALAKGYTLASVFNDAPLMFYIPGQAEPWRPQNTYHTFGGPTRLRVALAKSVNLVSVRLLMAINVPYTLKYISHGFGFDATRLPRNLSLALGTGEITPLEQARGYSVFANGGYLVTPYFIDHVNDTQGNPIYQAQPKVAPNSAATAPATNTNTNINTNNANNTNSNVNASPTNPAAPASTTPNNPSQYAPQAIPPQIAFLMTSALQDVIHRGTGTAALVLNRNDLAGKTGTTNDQVDTWFAGFNSDVVGVAWVGFDQPSSVHEYGAMAALPMWIDFMRVALAGKPLHTMPEPPGIISSNIDPNTGLLTQGGIPEYFRSNNVPAPSSNTSSMSSDNSNSDNGSSGTGNSNSNNSEPLF